VIDLSKLNERQREAVLHVDGPLLVSAGAGSGKTRVITYRIAHLIYDIGVDPTSILAVTFTNKAANEMRERVIQLLDAKDVRLTVSTFHSYCAKLLRRHAPLVGYPSSFTIADVPEQERTMKKVLERLGTTGTARRWLSVVSDAKEEGLFPEDIAAGKGFEDPRVLGPVYQGYQTALREQSAFDFDDLLLFAVRVLEKNPEVLERYQNDLQHILIDEYQDTNALQFRLVKMLATSDGRGLCVVGDEDQSIYGWRGASIDHIRRFERDFKNAKVVLLEENYRSTGQILEGASSLIGHNRNRYAKTLWTSKPAGNPIVHIRGDDAGEEVTFVVQEIRDLVATGETPVAILYRANHMSRAFEDGLVHAGVKYKIVGSLRFYERKEIKDLSAYLRLLINPKDVQAFIRAANVPPRKGLGPKSLEAVVEFARREGLDLVAAAAKCQVTGTLSAAASAGMRDFTRVMNGIDRSETQIAELLLSIISLTRYEERLKEAESPEDAEDRIGNVHEFVEAAREFDDEGRGALFDFIDSISLTAAQDEVDNAAPVALMTIHCAKGLEFPSVFLVNMAENAFPLAYAAYRPDELEEERRLCYVGMTRAMRRLYLTSESTRLPSRFLSEISRSGAMVTRSTESGSAAEEPETGSSQDRAGSASDRLSGGERFSRSDRVFHDTFGEGIVLGVEGRGDTARLMVAFDQYGVKRLVAGYAKLKRL